MLEAPSLIDVQVPSNGKLTVCGDVHGKHQGRNNRVFGWWLIVNNRSILWFYQHLRDKWLSCWRSCILVQWRFCGSWQFLSWSYLDIVCLQVALSQSTVFGTWQSRDWQYEQGVWLWRRSSCQVQWNHVQGKGENTSYKNMMNWYWFSIQLFSETFNALPLAHVIENKILVVHGGLFSKDDVTLDDIRKIDRLSLGQPGTDGKWFWFWMDVTRAKWLVLGLMCELLWSDPQPEPGRGASKRGVGIQFGPDVTKNFLERNNLGKQPYSYLWLEQTNNTILIDMLIRSHEVKENGYVIEHDGKCVTVFSAPNYWQVWRINVKEEPID